MKQALFILAAFFLLAPCVLRGQDFEVVSPASRMVAFDVSEPLIYIDSSITLRNVSNSETRVYCEIVPNFNSPLTFFNGSRQNQFTIPQNQSIKIPLYFNTNNNGGFTRARMYISDSTRRDTIDLEARAVLRCIDTVIKKWYVKFTKINVGEKVCTPLKARNGTSQPINIYSIKEVHTNDTNSIVLDTILTLPFVLLPGEDVTVATLCYTATLPNEGFNAKYSVNSSVLSNIEIEVSASSTEIKDTNLEKKCIDLSQEKSIIGPILFGGDTVHTLFFKSNRYDTTFVNDVVFFGGDGLMFKMVKPLPDTILPLSLTPIKVRFSPTTLLPVVKDRFAVDARFTTSCGNFSIDLSALAMQPTADSISTPLFPDKEYVLGMSSSAPSFSQDFHFVNNGLTNTKIVSVGLADPSPEFVVTNITPTNTLPFTLLPGEKMTVSVLFTPSQVGKVFFNQLVITTEQGIQSVSYPLQGLRTTTSGVHESSEPSVSVSLTPNPASASVTVNVKDAGQIDGAAMTDELGKTIFYYNQPQQPEWKWELNPTRIAAGTYFIRINGKTVEGKPFVVTKRLVVQ